MRLSNFPQLSFDGERKFALLVSLKLLLSHRQKNHSYCYFIVSYSFPIILYSSPLYRYRSFYYFPPFYSYIHTGKICEIKVAKQGRHILIIRGML